MVVSATEYWRAGAIAVDVQTTIGAGDSFVAGMVWGISRDESLLKAFQLGMASGAAALLRPGTSLCTPENVYSLIIHFSIKY